MLNLFKNKNGQNTAEYAVLIALVVAAAIAMQTYVKRSMQAGTKFAVDKLKKNAAGSRGQYEPYYTASSYDVTQSAYVDTVETKGDSVQRISGAKDEKGEEKLHITTRTGEEKIKGTAEQTGEKKY